MKYLTFVEDVEDDKVVPSKLSIWATNTNKIRIEVGPDNLEIPEVIDLAFDDAVELRNELTKLLELIRQEDIVTKARKKNKINKTKVLMQYSSDGQQLKIS